MSCSSLFLLIPFAVLCVAASHRHEFSAALFRHWNIVPSLNHLRDFDGLVGLGSSRLFRILCRQPVR